MHQKREWMAVRWNCIPGTLIWERYVNYAFVAINYFGISNYAELVNEIIQFVTLFGDHNSLASPAQPSRPAIKLTPKLCTQSILSLSIQFHKFLNKNYFILLSNVFSFRTEYFCLIIVMIYSFREPFPTFFTL